MNLRGIIPARFPQPPSRLRRSLRWRLPGWIKNLPLPRFPRLRLRLGLLRYGLILCLLTGLVLVHTAFGLLYPYYIAAQKFDVTEVSRHRTGSVVVNGMGQSIGRVFATNLDPVTMEDLPPHLVEALIATEDAKFFRHQGTDLVAILRAAIVNLHQSRISQGASTITQQLARAVFQMRERTFERKLLELFLARRIEQHYTKTEILEQYLNRIYFGSGCWGIGAAARDYFNKSVQELSIEESALLVGIIKRPVGFSPYLNPEAALTARNRTLSRMEKLGFLTPDDSLHFQSRPVVLQPQSARANRPHYLLDQIEHETRRLLQERNLPMDGYVIHTSAHLDVQTMVRASVSAFLEEVENSVIDRETFRSPSTSARNLNDDPSLQAAVVVLHNRTGRILASVGGRSYELSQFNRVFQARRPAGSTFLPFVYASVFEHPRMSPRTLTLDTAMDNRKVMLGGLQGVLGEWNSERLQTLYEGEVPAAYALLHSKNAATVRLGSKVGLSAVCDLAREAGFDSELRRFPATFLGASEVSLLELTRAYTLFPNQGLKPGPASLVDFISTPHGSIIYQRPDNPEVPLLSNRTAGQISRILQTSLYRDPDSPAPDGHGLCSLNLAGKSGTVHDFTDAWFVGYDADYTCGVWVGFDQPRKLYGGGFGRQLALPLWVRIMNQLGTDSPLPTVEFFDPHGPLFCEFPHGNPGDAARCDCLLHRSPQAASSVALREADVELDTQNAKPVLPQVPILTGEDPYGSTWRPPATPN